MGYSGGYGNYGPPSMMASGPPHMGGHGGHGMGGHGRGMGNSGGMVPFRAGDWKCGSEGCGYHNFAKNVSCLRCGASRAGAAVVAESGFSSPIDAPSGYNMGPPSVAGTPGPGPFASTAGGGFNSGSGFPGQHYGGPPSTYALPSGLGAATGLYPPMNAGQFGPSGAAGSGGAGGPFDSRAAEAAFSNAGQGPPPSGGPAGNGFYSSHSDDPFAFLSTGLGGLTMNDESRRNGERANKSPA